MFKETKQKSLEEIDLFFGEPVTRPVQPTTNGKQERLTADAKPQIIHTD
jgi:hypothetical protein